MPAQTGRVESRTLAHHKNMSTTRFSSSQETTAKTMASTTTGIFRLSVRRCTCATPAGNKWRHMGSLQNCTSTVVKLRENLTRMTLQSPDVEKPSYGYHIPGIDYGKKTDTRYPISGPRYVAFVPWERRSLPVTRTTFTQSHWWLGEP